MADKKNEGIIKAGVVGAAIGASLGAAAVAMADKGNRDKAANVAKDLTQRAQDTAAQLRGRLGGASSKTKKAVDRVKKDTKSRARKAERDLGLDNEEKK